MQTEKRKQSKHAYYVKNKEKLAISQKEKDKIRRYGITQAQYLEMYERQNGCCRICGDWKEVLQVDHSHKNNEVRELLCPPCNRGIGLLKDDFSILYNAYLYLKKFQ